MKIGIVLSNTPSYSETFFNSKIKGLINNGFQVELFTQKKSKSFDLSPVFIALPVDYKSILLNIPFIGMKLFQLILQPKVVLSYVTSERKDGKTWKQVIKGIYTNAHILVRKLDWLHFGFTTMALGKENVANSIDAKMAVSFRGFDMAIYPIKYPNCYRILWEKVDKIHTISNDLLAIAYNNGLPKSIPVYKITPAIDTMYFYPSTSSSSIIEPVKILTVGRLHWKKGLRDILIAMRQLKNNKINFKYTVVGVGDQYEELTYIIHQFGLEDCVFLVGKKSREEIRMLYKEHQFYIQYSISEGFCNAVLEAQAMGLLCIVSNAEGLPENIENNRTGWVVPKNDYITLTSKIIEVINLPDDKKKSISINAQERVRKYFTIEQQQKQFVQFYLNS